MDSVTPHEAWFGSNPDVHFLRVFGCRSYAKNTAPHLKKLDDRSRPVVMLGYEPGGKAYRLYDPETRKIVVSRDMVFDENTRWSWDGKDTEACATEEFIVEYFVEPTVTTPATAPEAASPFATPAPAEPCTPAPWTPATGASSTSTTPEPSASAVVRFATPPSSPDPELFDAGVDPAEPHRYRSVRDLYLMEGAEPEHEERLLLTPHGEPSTFAEAEQDEHWRAAMHEELASIEANHTWSVSICVQVTSSLASSGCLN
jgi:hypothetical protein